MIWRPYSHKLIMQTVDFLTVLVSFLLGIFIWRKFIQFSESFSLNPNENFFFIAVFISSLFILVLAENGAYSYQRFSSFFREFSTIVKSVFYVALFSLSIFYLFGIKSYPRLYFLVQFIIIIILLLFEKALLMQVANIIRKNGRNTKRIIVVGTGTRASKFIAAVKKNKSWGLEIIGLLTGEFEKIGQKLYGLPIIDHYQNIRDVIKKFNPEEIIITISTKRFDKLREVLELCEQVGIQVRLNSDFFGHLAKNIRVDKVFDLNIISFSFTKNSEIQLLLKRIFDFVISLILLILLSPLFILISVLIYIQDGSPIFYQWNVVGYNRKPIKSWKFRTMVKNADEIKRDLLSKNEMSGPVFKLSNDPRILPLGKILRKYSLDELPQLFSVLKGDLSLVGPRPPLQYEFNEFDLWHRRKLSVKPGLTCLWQISGRSNIKNFDDWARLDLEYIDNWSLLLDLKILIKTIPVVLFGKGAK